MDNITTINTIDLSAKIFIIRRARVMLDRDLAELFEMETKAVNQAVDRNQSRFPPDIFCFRLDEKEKEEVIKCDHLKTLKYSHELPRVFTEQGVAALAGVLRSPVADRMSVMIANEFVRLKTAEKNETLALLMSDEEMTLLVIKRLESKISEQKRLFTEEVDREHTRALLAEKTIDALAPAVEAHDTFLNADGLFTIQEAADSIGIEGVGRNMLFSILRDKRILLDGRLEGQRNLPRADLKPKYFRVKYKVRKTDDGKDEPYALTLVTPAGVDYCRKIVRRFLNNEQTDNDLSTSNP